MQSFQSDKDKTVDNYKIDGFTHEQNHEYRMACEVTKQKDQEIEILKLQIELSKLTRKIKIEK